MFLILKESVSMNTYTIRGYKFKKGIPVRILDPKLSKRILSTPYIVKFVNNSESINKIINDHLSNSLDKYEYNVFIGNLDLSQNGGKIKKYLTKLNKNNNKMKNNIYIYKLQYYSR